MCIVTLLFAFFFCAPKKKDVEFVGAIEAILVLFPVVLLCTCLKSLTSGSASELAVFELNFACFGNPGRHMQMKGKNGCLDLHIQLSSYPTVTFFSMRCPC